MIAKNFRMIIGLLIVAVLAIVGSLLFANNIGPASVQSQDGWPTLVPPDPTVAAQFLNMPACCDDQNPTIITLSPEQSLLATQNALASQQTSPETVATSDVVFQGQYFEPSADWVIYTDVKSGYSFAYPANFTVIPSEETGLQTDVFNRRFDDGLSYNASSYALFHLSVFAFDDKPTEASMMSYIASRHTFDATFWSVVEESNVELAKGYSGVKQVLKPQKGQQKTRIFLEHMGRVFLFVYFDSTYNDVAGKILESAVLP